MKAVKFGFMALATAVAGTAAFAHSHRAVGRFIQTAAGSGTWVKIAPADYNPANCQDSQTLFCTYTVNTTALPAGQTSYTTSQLQTAHAVGHDANKVYVQ